MTQLVEPSGLPCRPMTLMGKRDRRQAPLSVVQQIPKPISWAGIVYVDNNYNLMVDSGERVGKC